MALASMTGYARAEGGDNAVSWVWEAKSVNGRGLEVRLRLPGGFDRLEGPARDAAARAVKRGNLQVSLSLGQAGEAGTVRINHAVVERLLAECRRAPDLAPPGWDALLGVRGVVEAQEQPDDSAERDALILKTLDQAMAGLAQARRAEGDRLAVVLTGLIDEMAALGEQAAVLAAARAEQAGDRLAAGVAALLAAGAPLSPDRLAQELALLAVKTDVREELDRLNSHIAAARDLLAGGEAVGRRFDFLAQEFNREANTLCSKSQDKDLTRIGLDLKVAIDRLREQVQNIE